MAPAWRGSLAALLSAAVIGVYAHFGVAASDGAAPPAPSSLPSDAEYLDAADTLDIAGLQDRFESIAHHAAGAVVAVSATVSGGDASDDAQPSDDMNPEKLQEILDRNTRTVGAGFIIDPDGYILTNQHVIESAQDIWVTTEQRKVLPAVVVGSDPRADLAVLKIPATKLPTVQLQVDQTFERGQWTIALGNPYGLSTDGQLCMSVGVISATDRALPRLSIKEDRLYSHLIQTTAQINPGNSGGPLLDIRGRVIGINTAVILPQKQTNGIGFAIPITSRLMAEVHDLEQGREIVYGYLGISVAEPAPNERESAGAPPDIGVRVESIEPDSPAALCGLELGDLITSIGGTDIEDSDQFIRLVGDASVGQPVKLALFRQGKSMTLMAIPKRRPMEETAVTHDSQRLRWRGMLLGPIPADWQSEPDKPRSGLLVVGIDDASPMKKQGISRGSVITSIAGHTVESVIDLLSLINQTPPEDCTVEVAPSLNSPTTRPVSQVN